MSWSWRSKFTSSLQSCVFSPYRIFCGGVITMVWVITVSEVNQHKGLKVFIWQRVGNNHIKHRRPEEWSRLFWSPRWKYNYQLWNMLMVTIMDWIHLKWLILFWVFCWWRFVDLLDLVRRWQFGTKHKKSFQTGRHTMSWHLDSCPSKSLRIDHRHILCLSQIHDNKRKGHRLAGWTWIVIYADI